jgi:hypothetical protein
MKKAPCKNSLLGKIFPQLIILLLIGILYSLSILHLIPSPTQLNGVLVQSFKTYGLPLIAICSFLENLIGVNIYFPGAFTILTGMALTSGHPVRAIVTYFTIYLPALVANVLSFYFGLASQQSSATTIRRRRNSLIWFFFTYWHPQLAAVTAFSAGAEGLLSKSDFLKHAIGISLFWSVFWGVVIYNFGVFANVTQNLMPIFLGYVVIWTAVDINKWLRSR